MKLLNSKILGEGKPLLILHGYFGMSDNWKTLGIKFAANHQVHLIDQRNHGRSFHTDTFNYEVLVEDLYNYIQEHKLENCCLIGHSMGGKTAMLFAVTYPELIDKLIIVDISPREYKPHHNEILTGLNSIDFSIQNTRKLVDKKLSILIPELGVRQFLLKNVYWVEKGKLAFRFNLESLTINNPEVGVGLPPFTIFKNETLFLKGSYSNYISSKDEPIIKKHFPNSKILEIANAGHWLHAENQKDFYESAIHFLR